MDVSSIIFPEASRSIATTLTSLKRTNLSIKNRLHSIASDAHFVESIANAYDLPLIANERCGSWYIPADRKRGSAYFKSTDGHYGQWAFSLRRLNLQVLDIIGQRGGCIIVDSTRRGKSMPDALSKTVPIWICVLNRLLFPDDHNAGRLRTPEDVVSRSEHAQIEERLWAFVEQARGLMLDTRALHETLHKKPMEPCWVTPDRERSSQSALPTDRNVIVLCTASGRTLSSDESELSYVQGAADDSESWALGLDAASFWMRIELLLSLSEDELPLAIEDVVLASQTRAKALSVVAPSLIRPGSSVWIGTNAAAKTVGEGFDLLVICSDETADSLAIEPDDRHVALQCGSGKVGSRKLRAQLPKLDELADRIRPDTQILVTCPSSKDLAVGVALAIISLYCNDDGTLVGRGSSAVLSKTLIKHRLSWIMVSMPGAAPSRATLQSVNAFLLG